MQHYTFTAGLRMVAIRSMLFLISAVVSNTTAFAAVIDFEQIPVASSPGYVSPTDGLQISTQFNRAPWNVEFYLDDPTTFGRDGVPVLAQVGGKLTAFVGPTGNDGPAVSDLARVGSFFLTDDGVLGTTSPLDIVIDYGVPVRGASADIIDVDGAEAWTITGYGGLGGTGTPVTAPVTISPLSTTTLGDGKAFPFTVTTISGQPTIRSLRLAFSGASAGGIGLGFDNFETSFVPEPGSLTLMLLGCLGSAVFLNRRCR